MVVQLSADLARTSGASAPASRDSTARPAEQVQPTAQTPSSNAPSSSAAASEAANAASPRQFYISPFLTFDSSALTVIFQVRDSESGDVTRQFPAESVVERYRRDPTARPFVLPEQAQAPEQPAGPPPPTIGGPVAEAAADAEQAADAAPAPTPAPTPAAQGDGQAQSGAGDRPIVPVGGPVDLVT